jgi:hypothetical protein
MEGQRQFFIELRRAVEQAVKSGKKLNDIVSASTPIQLSANVKNCCRAYER